MYGRCLAAVSQIEFFEDTLWDFAYYGHDGRPDEGDVEFVFPGVDCGDDGLGDCVWVCHLFASGHSGGHGGGGGGGLVGEDGDARAVDTVAQAGEEGRQPSLRGAVDVVGLAAAIAGY